MKLTALPSKASSAFKTLFWVCIMALSACSETPSDSPQTDEIKSDNQDASTPPLRAPAADRLKDEGSAKSAKKENQVLQGFINEIDQYYANLQADTEALYQQVITFAKAPSESALENSINAWEQAHNRYLAGQFLNQLFKDLFNTEALDQPGPDIHLRIDAHPLLPGYLDTVSGYPYSGLIHSDIPLTLASLYQEFQLGDPAYVTLGFHALEVMLKGTDQERKLSDFAKLKALQEKHETDPELRRSLYSNLLAEQIRQDIFQLPANWRQNIRGLLFSLNESQSIGLKSRLVKSIKEQNANSGVENTQTQAEADEHFNELASTMKQDLQKRILLSLDTKTTP